MKSILYKDLLDIVFDYAGFEEVQLCADVFIYNYKCDLCWRWRRRNSMYCRDYYSVTKNECSTDDGGEIHIFTTKVRYSKLHLCARCVRNKVLKRSGRGKSVKTTDLYPDMGD